jgi:hypothetical protein
MSNWLPMGNTNGVPSAHAGPIGGVDPSVNNGVGVPLWGRRRGQSDTLRFGTTQQVREEVLRHAEVFAPGGGCMFNTMHNIQPKPPVENVVAMVDAIHDFNGRP